jgi:hypothetical protein
MTNLMNARIYGLFWLLAPSLFLVCSTPATGQSALLGTAEVAAGEYLGHDTVIKTTFIGSRISVVAPKGNANAEAFPSADSNYVFAEAIHDPGTRDHGGEGGAGANIFYVVQDAKGNVVSAKNVVHMKFRIGASTDVAPGSRDSAGARVFISEMFGQIKVPLLTLETFDHILGATLVYKTNLGVDVQTVGKAYFVGTLDFYNFGEFSVDLAAGASLTGLGTLTHSVVMPR